jgi:hypothetical protein
MSERVVDQARQQDAHIAASLTDALNRLADQVTSVESVD